MKHYEELSRADYRTKAWLLSIIGSLSEREKETREERKLKRIFQIVSQIKLNIEWAKRTLTKLAYSEASLL